MNTLYCIDFISRRDRVHHYAVMHGHDLQDALENIACGYIGGIDLLAYTTKTI